MSDSNPTSFENELRALRERVQQLEHRDVRRRRVLRRGGVLIALSTVFFVGTVLAADGSCPNGLPFCFAANQPALASEVNHNFSQVREWLEQKVGRTDAGVSLTGDISVNGRIRGGNPAGNLHLDAVNSGLYLNWFSGSSGVYFGNAAQGHVGRVDTSGNLTLSGSATLGASGGNVPFSCVVRSSTITHNVTCAPGEFAIGGGARCPSLWRITESGPWGGAADNQPWVEGQPARAWRSVCQVWGSAGNISVPQLGAFAICCRQ